MHDALDDGAITVLPFAKRMSPKKGRRNKRTRRDTDVALLDYLDRTLLGPVTRLAIYSGMRRASCWPYVGCNRLGEPGATCAPVLEVVGTGKDRAVRFKEPKTEKSRRDVALTAGAIESYACSTCSNRSFGFTSTARLATNGSSFRTPRWPAVEARHILERVLASREGIGLAKGDIPWFASLVRVDLTAGRHALKVVSEMLGHTTTAITADLYTHVLGNLKAEAADRLDAIFDKAKCGRAAGAESDAWAKCGPIKRVTPKKFNKKGRFW